MFSFRVSGNIVIPSGNIYFLNSDAMDENSTEDDENREVSKIEKKDICWAYRYNKCPHKNGEGCPKKHPKKCKKFCDYGHIAKDKNGCDTQSCDLLHPKLCRNSTRSKECPYRNCNFQHLQGTVIVQERKNGNARSVRRNMPENERVEILVENLTRVVELMTKMIQNSEMRNNVNIKLPDHREISAYT